MSIVGKLVVGWILVAVLMIGVGAYWNINQSLIIEPQYKRAIGDYVLNAEDSANLQGWAKYLPLAKQGMISAGLTVDMYNSAFSWDQTPQNRMDFQYYYIDQVYNRTLQYINQTKTQNISQFSDVYNTMLSNLRNESNRNGPLDWVAHDAWLLKNYPFYWWYGYYYLMFGLPLAGIAILSLWLAVRTDSAKTRAEYERKWER